MGDFNLRCTLDQSDIVQSEPALHPHEGCCQVSKQNLGIEWSCNLKICPRSLQRKQLSWQLQGYLTADLSASEGKQGCCWGLNWSSVSHGNAVLYKPPLQGFFILLLRLLFCEVGCLVTLWGHCVFSGQRGASFIQGSDSFSTYLPYFDSINLLLESKSIKAEILHDVRQLMAQSFFSMELKINQKFSDAHNLGQVSTRIRWRHVGFHLPQPAHC